LPDPTEGSYDWAKAGDANAVAIARAATILLMTSLRSARVDVGSMLTLEGKRCEAAHAAGENPCYAYSLPPKAHIQRGTFSSENALS
jgi:hypothetical protein